MKNILELFNEMVKIVETCDKLAKCARFLRRLKNIYRYICLPMKSEIIIYCLYIMCVQNSNLTNLYCILFMIGTNGRIFKNLIRY